jgi:4-hydroxy-3-methylbut-2-enyl diphosphate reductase
MTFGDVTIVLAKSYGFCWGVERALALAFEARNFFPDQTIWITNEIIHNPSINKRLRDLEIKFIPQSGGTTGPKDFSGVQKGDIVILPAFGASIDEMAIISEIGASIVDTTCPWVSKVWSSVESNKKKNFTSIIHGKWTHEESIGTASFADKYLIILNMKEAEYVAEYMLNGGDKEEFMLKFQNAASDDFDPDFDLQQIGIANQTTMLKGETELIGKLFERVMIRKYGPQSTTEHFMSFNTICDATQERQDAMYEMVGAQYEKPKSELYESLEK